MEEQTFLSSCADKKEGLINHSALFCCAQRRVITCGTHFEETKLVASITGRPVPESMSISWMFTPVGTLSWGTMKLKQLFLDLIPLKMGGTTNKYLAASTLLSKFTCWTLHLMDILSLKILTMSYHTLWKIPLFLHPVQSVKVLACSKEMIQNAKKSKLSQKLCHLSCWISKKM